MSYTSEALLTIADCDNVLASARKEKSQLEYLKITNSHQQEGFAENSGEVNAELASKQAELDNINLNLPNLAEGTYKQTQRVRQKALELAVLRLTVRKESVGSVAMLNKQLDIACIDRQVEEIDVFIAAVEARKVELA